MQALLKAFWSIALLRSGPQNLPASPLLLALCLAVHWLIGWALAAFRLSPAHAAAGALVGTLIMAGLVQALLLLRSRGSRVVQTLTAMAGGEALLGTFMIPLSAWFFAVPESVRVLPALLSLLVLGWTLAMAGNIFRHALDVSAAAGFLAAVGYLIASIALSDLIVPVQ